MPSYLSDFAGIERGSKVLVIGNYGYLEIWNSADRSAFQDDLDIDIGSMLDAEPERKPDHRFEVILDQYGTTAPLLLEVEPISGAPSDVVFRIKKRILEKAVEAALIKRFGAFDLENELQRQLFELVQNATPTEPEGYVLVSSYMADLITGGQYKLMERDYSQE